jgi:hypothetical protein
MAYQINCGTRVFPQFRQQLVLYHIPALHDQFGTGSIHFRGRYDVGVRTSSCQKWPTMHPSIAFTKRKFLTDVDFCKRLN